MGGFLWPSFYLSIHFVVVVVVVVSVVVSVFFLFLSVFCPLSSFVCLNRFRSIKLTENMKRRMRTIDGDFSSRTCTPIRQLITVPNSHTVNSNVFYISAAISVVAAAFFLIFASGNVQVCGLCRSYPLSRRE